MELKDSKILSSTDHAAIQGMHKWSSKNGIFRRVVFGEEKQGNTDILERGLFMEHGHSNMVASNLSRNGYKVVLKRAPTLFYEVDGVPMRLTGDYFAVPSSRHRKALFGVELKQAHGQQRSAWGEAMSDDVPEMYKIQAIMQCYRYGWPFVILDADFSHHALSTPFLIRADNERAAQIEQDSVKFWKDHILTGIAPEVDDSDECRKTLLERERFLDSQRQMTPEEIEHANRIVEIVTMQDELDSEKKKLQNKLIKSSGSYERLTHPVLVGDGGNGKLVDKNFAVFTADKNGKRAARCYPKTFAGGL
jgi:hypothetical protein